MARHRRRLTRRFNLKRAATRQNKYQSDAVLTARVREGIRLNFFTDAAGYNALLLLERTSIIAIDSE
jgi:hypothetical protein